MKTHSWQEGIPPADRALLSGCARVSELVTDVSSRVRPEMQMIKSGYSAFHESALQEKLVALQVECVVVCGHFLDLDVEATARDAVDLGFRTAVVADASVGLSPQDEEEALERLAVIVAVVGCRQLEQVVQSTPVCRSMKSALSKHSTSLVALATAGATAAAARLQQLNVGEATNSCADLRTTRRRRAAVKYAKAERRERRCLVRQYIRAQCLSSTERRLADFERRNATKEARASSLREAEVSALEQVCAGKVNASVARVQVAQSKIDHLEELRAAIQCRRVRVEREAADQTRNFWAAHEAWMSEGGGPELL
mmetsp:Transcript_16080/g.40898  ORF Transcript_16080/g.40898 Transcript_16080/m.40898 type:complete len:312 (-) Transcript_16080:134-1069(-)